MCEKHFIEYTCDHRSATTLKRCVKGNQRGRYCVFKTSMPVFVPRDCPECEAKAAAEAAK